MGRKPTPAADLTPTPINEVLVRADLDVATDLAKISAIGTDAVRLGMYLGRIETANLFQTISDSVRLSAFDGAQQSKAYLNMINPKTQNAFGSIEEFCEQMLGVGYERMRQISRNRDVLGQEAFEQAERLGMRNKDYQAMKALPAPEKEMIRQAIEEATSRDEVLDILQELAVRHAKEKEALIAERDEAKETAESRERLIQNKEARINAQDKEIAKLQRRFDTETPDEILAEIRHEVAKRALEAETTLENSLRPAVRALMEHHATNGGDSHEVLDGYLLQLERVITETRQEFGIDGGRAPAWVNAE